MKMRLELGNLMPQLDAKIRDGVNTTCKAEGLDADHCFVERVVHAEKARTNQLDEKSRAALKYVSTRTCDAEGDLVDPKGIVLTEFLKNPVFFWGHNYSLPPLGSDEFAEADNRGLKVKSIYGDTGPGTMAEVVWQLVRQGHQKQSSIGYVPLQMSKRTENDFQNKLDVLQKGWPELVESRKGVKRILHKVLMLEHSDVGIGMNRDAMVLQVAKEYGATDLMFKQMGISLMTDEMGVEDFEMKPFPNFHAARQTDPDKYKRIRYEKDKFGSGIDAVWGVTESNEVELQSIRFDASKFTPDEARKWLKEHDHKTGLEEATGEKKEAGVDGITTEDNNLDEIDGQVVDLVCPECGHKMKGKPGAVCPKCNAVMKCVGEEDEEKDLHAWFGGDKGLRSSYKLKHHRPGDKKPIQDEVKNCMGLLLGARGGVEIPDKDRKVVYDHLAEHYVGFGMDVPEFREYTQGELRKEFPELYESEYVRPIYVVKPTVRIVGKVTRWNPRIVSVGALIEQAMAKKLGRV